MAYLLVLIIEIPLMQPALATKLQISLSLQQGHLGRGRVDISVGWLEPEAPDDEFAKVIVVWRGQSLVFPCGKELVWVKGC